MNSAERHWYGLFLSLLTALMWGTPPIALQLKQQVFLGRDNLTDVVGQTAVCI